MRNVKKKIRKFWGNGGQFGQLQVILGSFRKILKNIENIR